MTIEFKCFTADLLVSNRDTFVLEEQEGLMIQGSKLGKNNSHISLWRSSPDFSTILRQHCCLGKV